MRGTTPPIGKISAFVVEAISAAFVLKSRCRPPWIGAAKKISSLFASADSILFWVSSNSLLASSNLVSGSQKTSKAVPMSTFIFF